MPFPVRSPSLPLVLGAALGFVATAARPAAADGFVETHLVSDIPDLAEVTDPDLVNPWGLVLTPGGNIQVSDNGSGLSTRYDSEGNPIGRPVFIPPPPGATGAGAPTGIVRNEDPHQFVFSSGPRSGAARLLFATEGGTIAAWNPSVSGAAATTVVDRSRLGSVYKGLAVCRRPSGHDRLFAADFRNNSIDIFGARFDLLRRVTDPHLPPDYAPFNLRELGGRLLVTFAQQKLPDRHDDQAGLGHGFVDVFDCEGHLLRRLISRGALDSPWGLALAPEEFGDLGGALLVGNFGDGRINAYDRASGAFLGPLRNPRGRPIAISGLWGISFRRAEEGDELDDDDDDEEQAEEDLPSLFFTAGIGGETHGLLGVLHPANDEEVADLDDEEVAGLDDDGDEPEDGEPW